MEEYIALSLLLFSCLLLLRASWRIHAALLFIYKLTKHKWVYEIVPHIFILHFLFHKYFPYNSGLKRTQNR